LLDTVNDVAEGEGRRLGSLETLLIEPLAPLLDRFHHLLLLQQHRHHNRLKRPRAREHDAGLHVPLGAVKEPIEECLIGFWQSPSEGRPPAKAGQHILYLLGELCRLANRLPAHLMATATRVWEHDAFLWERLNGRFLPFIQTLRNESA
jgi:hypothetical protein